MNSCLIFTLHSLLESALKRNVSIEMIVPRLKRIWPEARNRRELLLKIRAFAQENRWDAEIFDYRLRIRFVKD